MSTVIEDRTKDVSSSKSEVSESKDEDDIVCTSGIVEEKLTRREKKTHGMYCVCACIMHKSSKRHCVSLLPKGNGFFSLDTEGDVDLGLGIKITDPRRQSFLQKASALIP